MSYCAFLLALLSAWPPAAPDPTPAAPPAAGYVWPGAPPWTDASCGEDEPPDGDSLPGILGD
jgi:hypothetical protein